MRNKKVRKPILLMILDGFGIRKTKYYNGILNAHMSNYFNLWNSYPHTKLHASGPLVGLPPKQIGSSEVGHMTMGAGQLIKQPIVRVNEDIKKDKFKHNKVLIENLNYVIKTKGNVHLMGLLGDGGVHSSEEHLFALLRFFDENANLIKGDIYIHSFLDGRDTKQKSALIYLKRLERVIKKLKNSNKFHITDLCGRYYAMDRDKRWDRTKIAFDLLVNLKGEKFSNYKEAINTSYKNGITDEFVKPIILDSVKIKKNDLCLFYNFRSDRPKQLVQSFVDDKFDKFKRKFLGVKFVTLTDYSDDFSSVDVLYETIYPKNTLGEVISKNSLKQLRIAESEKFPHVTYFFSGLRYKKFKGETEIKINSPKVATYDLKPEMSAEEVTKRLIKEINKDRFDFILLNFANPDMVGHTGNFEAVKKALKKIDELILEIKKVIDEKNGLLIITADHGNCEVMRDNEKHPQTKHTYNLVPFIVCDKKVKLRKDYENLSLFNIAPTILEFLNLEKPIEMSESLISQGK